MFESIDVRNIIKHELKLMNFSKDNKCEYLLIYEFTNQDGKVDYMVIGRIDTYDKGIITSLIENINNILRFYNVKNLQMIDYCNEYFKNNYANKHIHYTKEGYDFLSHKFLFTNNNVIRTVSVNREDGNNSAYDSNYTYLKDSIIDKEEVFMPLDFYQDEYLFSHLEYPNMDPHQMTDYVAANRRKLENMHHTFGDIWKTQELKSLKGSSNYDIYLGQCVDVKMQKIIAEKGGYLINSPQKKK